jgi:hypothetical protein
LAGDRGRLRPGRRSHERRRPAVAVPDDQHGSAPLSPWLVHTWAERYGIDIINFFGSNEGTALLSGPIDLPDPEQRASFFPPDEVLGERVCAVVVPGARKPSLEDLVAYLRERQVAAFKLPERPEYADALPRNPVGKILKRQLRESLE